MSETTYERLEFGEGLLAVRRPTGMVSIPSALISPEGQLRLAEWLLMEPSPDPIEIGDTVSWNGWEWEVIGLADKTVWMRREYGQVICAYREAPVKEVRVR